MTQRRSAGRRRIRRETGHGDYPVIEPDIVVDDAYTFTLGGVRFEVIWLNGAEGRTRSACGCRSARSSSLVTRSARTGSPTSSRCAARTCATPTRRRRPLTACSHSSPRCCSPATLANSGPLEPIPLSRLLVGRPYDPCRRAHAHARRNPLRARHHRRRHERGQGPVDTDARDRAAP